MGRGKATWRFDGTMEADAKFPPYTPTGGEPGYDGHPAKERKSRDLDGEGKRDLTVLRRVCWLDKLEDDGHIESVHREAADNLRGDWECIQIGGASVSWANIGASRQPYTGLSDGICRSLDHFGEAWEAVPKMCRPFIGHMVLDNHSKDYTATMLQTDRRAVLPYIRVGLDALAVHYGLKYTAPLELPGRKW